MDTSPYTFYIEYSDGLKVTPFDLNNPENRFLIKVFIRKTKINSQLKWNYGSSGAKWIEEETTNAEDFLIGWGENTIQSNYYYTYFYKGFAPYYIEIYDLTTNELAYSEHFDIRHKLINFTLHSDNTETLHTWICAIEKFKKENNCQISIINDYLKQNQKYDFVDSYWSVEENFERYYAGYHIGRFGDENAPNLFNNPDGIKGKNDLEIIDDILYHYTKSL